MNRSFSKILILLILVIFTAGGIFAWQYFGRPEEKVKDETANWKTYRNEEHGFEIKYPENWIFNQDVMSFDFSSGEIIKGSDEFSCSLSVSLVAKGANAEYINSLPKEKWQRSEIDMNGKSAIKLVSVDSPIKAYYFLENSGNKYSFQIYHNTTRYITNQEGYKVALGFIYNQECMDIFNQILSTFKFIETQPTGQSIIQKCADGTLYGQCSSNKPKYCEKGNLINKASLCGCLSGYQKSNDECEKIVSTPTQDVDTFLKDIFGDKVNFITSENPNIFLGNDIGQHLFDTSWTNCQPMIDKVNESTAGKSTNYEKAKSIINWLANSRQYSEPSPLTAGKNMCESFSVNYGICHDSAYLGVAMLRLASIPSRVLGPVKGLSHNYVEFYSDGKWYGIDGTFCQPCGGERVALERSSLFNIFQISKFDQPKELTSLEGWKGNYTGRTFQYSVKSVILITNSKKNLLAENEKIEWGELTYINPFYETSNSRFTGAKIIAKDLYCDFYECSRSQGANQEIYLPSGNNILIAGDRITYQNGKKIDEINNITADQPFLFEDFYITTTLPPGQYQFWYGNIAFADIKINVGDKIEIKPDTLVKPSNITQNEFNNFIAYLKTVK